MARISRRELAAHVALALGASALALLLSAVFGIPPYSIQMALIVIAILIPAEFAAIAAWESLKKREVELKQGILPPRTKIR